MATGSVRELTRGARSRAGSFAFDLQLFASGAGLNRASTIALSIQDPTITVVGSPRTAYGTTGVNDTGPIPVLAEARDFTKWTFSLLGSGSGYSFTIYGTLDPLAYAAWKNEMNPNLYINSAVKPSPPASSWFILPAPSEQSGTGSVANPLTDTAPLLQYSGTLVGVRVVLTGSATPAGLRQVAIEVAP